MKTPEPTLPNPLFAPLSPLLACLPPAPDGARFASALAERQPRNARGVRLRFLAPPDDDLHYETRVWRHGIVATRSQNWHDFFNALVWLTFPFSKAALNARHVASLAADDPRAERSRPRDALTHFDECGAFFVASDSSLLASLRAFRWRELFWERRSALQRSARCLVFGHATYDQLRQPFRGLTAKTVLYEVEADWFDRSLNEQLATLDERFADELAAGAYRDTRAFHPLPLLGFPGLTPENERADYYDDVWQFRPGRRTGSV